MSINERILIGYKNGNLDDKCPVKINNYRLQVLNSQTLLVPKLTNFKTYNYQKTFET